jgi:PadR family transcriptional regulator, regulatory protein PadR
MRISREALRVLQLLEANPDAQHYGLEVIRATRVQAGTLYPILTRLERAGWLESNWENLDEKASGRPARRYYTVTPQGLREARAELRKEADLMDRLGKR